ncbi:M14 family zinc carboxypeptidase [Natronogracilivirga saccharolytica]|nr:M14 family zinc carboxypeptidase [Natronogracilivirga saccharolytica]
MWNYDRFLKELDRTRPNVHENEIGRSEQGKPIFGFVFGEGDLKVSLMAGAHADEPVGPNTLYKMTLGMLQHPGKYHSLFRSFRFIIIPHINPDGDQANSAWMHRWPDFPAYFQHAKREKPGRDIEFGYPEMRPENCAATDFWNSTGGADIHFSLHGMAYSEGYLLLINDQWEQDTRPWRQKYDRQMALHGLLPHDYNRNGEKGFNYFGPGFSSTPKGSAMRDFFLQKGDEETSSLFHDSSMEFHLKMNPDALCMVTELPLFLVNHSGNSEKPLNYLALKEELEELRGAGKWEGIENVAARYGLRPFPLSLAMMLQRYTIGSALELIR